MAILTNNTFELVTFGDVKEDGSPDVTKVLFRLPVPHNQMKVPQSVRIDEIEISGRSGKIKQAVGYEDTPISINVVLVDEEINGAVLMTANEQFEVLQNAFRARDNESLPRLFSIASRLTDLCRIKTVLFKNLEVKDTPGSNDLSVIINLVEFSPISAQVEKQALRKQTADEAAAEADEATNEYNDELGVEESPLQKAYREGNEAAKGQFDGEQPTTDTDDGSEP